MCYENIKSMYITLERNYANKSYEGQPISHSNNFFFVQKCGNVENGVQTSESMWHILLNVTIRWGCMYSDAHTLHMQTSCWQPNLEMEVCKIPPSYIIMLQPTQQTLSRTFPSTGECEVLQHPPIPPNICSMFMLYATIIIIKP
jgi:hypothetical protein